jgi:acetyl-CoA C-acetyltransferase
VLVGAGQLTRHPAPEDLASAGEPAAMMAAALDLAAEDSGAGAGLLAAADSIRVMELLSWHYANPAALVAELVGATPSQTLRTTTGGNSPQMLVNATAAAIGRGELDVALICGAEAVFSRLLARKAKVWLPWTQQPPDTPAPAVIGDDRPGTCDAEMSRSVMLPVQIYPVLENAIWAARGCPDDHRTRIAELWARFSRVAAGNPHAWTPRQMTAEEIATVSGDNRMVAFPYTKWLNANIQTDQAAALILCSADAARAAGVPRDRWVFPWAGADAHDHWFVSERDRLDQSPAIAAAGRAALALAGIGVDDLAAVDLYSCFPAAVEMAAGALGLALDDPDRPLTVTGGLTFAGGPGNNYATHSIASMVHALRAAPGTFGLVTALGWYVTKHAVGIYSTAPPPDGFRHAGDAVQAEVDALPRRVPAAGYEGPGTIESFTVTFERDNTPAVAIVACLVPGRGRAWATSADRDVAEALMAGSLFGREAVIASGGELKLG